MSVAETVSATRFTRPARSTVRVNLSESVNLETISRIVATIGGLSGCRACGLLGFDLQLVGDPAEFSEIQKLPGVQSVSLE